MVTALGLTGIGAGVLLLWSALTNVSPVDVVRGVFDPETGEPDPIAARRRPASLDLTDPGAAVPVGSLGGLVGLREPFRSNVAALLRAAGGRVTIVSGRRSAQQQIELRRKHCADVYETPAMACNPPTAKPGTSNHERGLAVDFGGDLALAARLAPEHHLRRTVPGEPWHFEPA